ncbi:MAG: hypothetical protein ACYCQI_04190 [Gammaproteobacteria bacterium]
MSKSRFIDTIGSFSPSRADEQFEHVLALPNRTYVCVDYRDRVHSIQVVTQLDRTPKKIATNLFISSVHWYSDNKLIIRGQNYDYQMEAFILDVESEEKKAVNPTKFNLKSIIKFKSGSKEYFAYLDFLDRSTVEIRDFDAPNETQSQCVTPYRDHSDFGVRKRLHANNLTAIGDKIVMGADRDSLFVLTIRDGKIISDRTIKYPDKANADDKPLYVYGSKEYLVLQQSVLSVIALKQKKDSSLFDFDFVTQLSDFKDGAVGFFPHTSLLAFVNKSGEKITIYDCQRGYGVTSTLPFLFKSDLNLTEDGRIVYRSDKGKMVILQGQFIFTRKADIAALLTESKYLTPDPANLVAGYLGDEGMTQIMLPILKMSDVDAVAAALRDQKIEDRSEGQGEIKHGPLFSSTSAKSKRDDSHLELIGNLRKAENDADRYILAMRFTQKYPDHAFTRELFSRMSSTQSPMIMPRLY